MFQVNIYAAYLYDAVSVLVSALDKVLLNGGDITDGAAILEHIIGHRYTSKYIIFLSVTLEHFSPVST